MPGASSTPPKILFLDEPTLGLGPQTRNQLWTQVRHLNETEGVTVFLTTHYMDEAERAVHRIAVIDHGPIVEQGSAIVFAALGTAIGSMLRDMQGFQLIMNFIVLPIFFLSGALYPLASLPAVLSAATRLDPLSYGIDGLRGALTGLTQIGLATDAIVLVVVGSMCLVLGGWSFRGFRSDSGAPAGASVPEVLSPQIRRPHESSRPLGVLSLLSWRAAARWGSRRRRYNAFRSKPTGQ